MRVQSAIVIDTLEVSVNREIPFTAEFRNAYRHIYTEAISEHYKTRADLRACGLPATLHYSCRFTRNHKLGILRVAERSFEQIMTTIQQVFECDPLNLRLARIDFAVDVPGIPVKWFRNHMCVPRKRRVRVFGLKPESKDDNSETIYFGSGADLVRVYDKVAEAKAKHRQLPPGENTVLTRVERQCRSGRIPRVLTTLADLMHNATTFNPFATVLLLSGGRCEPNIDDYLLRTYLEGTGFRQLVIDYGLQQVRNMFGSRSRGNASRKIRQLRDFLPPDPEGLQLPDLFSLYVRSLNRQLVTHARNLHSQIESLRNSELSHTRVHEAEKDDGNKCTVFVGDER